jgi:hypothetical protein
MLLDMIPPSAIETIKNKKDCMGGKDSATSRLVKSVSYAKWQPNDPTWGRGPTLAMFSRESKTEDDAAEALRLLQL